MSEFTPKELYFNNEAIQPLLTGAEKVYKAVSSTYGIAGHLVGFDSPNSVYPRFSKDGVSVSRQIALPDKAENIGAMLLIQAANKQVSDTGDGTTLTVILAYEIIKAGLKSVNSGVNPTVLRNEINECVGRIIEKLTLASIKVTPKLLHDVAIISCNNDSKLGGLIADAILKVGEYGVVTHDKSKTGCTYTEYSDGYQFNYGIKYQQFITNQRKQILELENPLVIISEKPLSWGDDLNKLVQASNKKPIVIINDELSEDGEAFQTILEAAKKGFRLYVIKTNINEPMRRKYVLDDLATLCGTKVYTKGWAKFEKSDFGTCEKIVSMPSKTTIITDKVALRRIKELKVSLSNTDNDAEKELIKESIARLSNGVATIRVSGATETEQLEILDRVDDAIRACKSAQEEGVIDGGGVALLKTANGFNQLAPGWNIILEAIQKPIAKLLSNANLKSDLIVEKILTGEAKGYDIFSGETTKTSMIENNIIDPLKVVRTALINAVSVASIVLQTNVLITDCKEE